MKKRKRRGAIVVWVVGLLVVAFFAYVTLTVGGAIRFAVARQGFPVQALSTGYAAADRAPFEGGQLYVLRDPPKDREPTGAVLHNWKVDKKGVFYLCRYYGEG